MAEPRRVLVVTGSRAEYGLLQPVMAAVAAAPDLALQVAVTGSHLMAGFGETWRTVADDGFAIDARVDLALADDTRPEAARGLGRAVAGFADAMGRLAPDIVVVLGDRYEILAAVTAAFMLGIPVMHLHGGERTEGAFDEGIRHAITKLSQLHGVAAEAFATRVRQLGEPPERVHVVGTLALDGLAATPRLDRSALARALDRPLAGTPLLVVTVHPETAMAGDAAATDSVAAAVLAALDGFAGAEVLFTLPNADPGNAGVRRAIEDWVARAGGRAAAFESLGRQRYWSLVGIADAVIGNSSSGIIEVPHLGVPVVNVGTRQQGRPRPPAVIDCPAAPAAVAAAVTRALTPAHRAIAARRDSPYGGAGAGGRVVEILRHTPLTGLTFKPFRDLPCHG